MSATPFRVSRCRRTGAVDSSVPYGPATDALLNLGKDRPENHRFRLHSLRVWKGRH
jgi:hypothetical protein